MSKIELCYEQQYGGEFPDYTDTPQYWGQRFIEKEIENRRYEEGLKYDPNN